MQITNNIGISSETQETRTSSQARDCREGEILRERIATSMWSEYHLDDE